MQCSSLRAHTMHSFQSVHFACSAAFAGTFTCSAALVGHLPYTAFRVYTLHAVQLSQGMCQEQLFRPHILAFRSTLSMQCSSSNAASGTASISSGCGTPCTATLTQHLWSIYGHVEGGWKNQHVLGIKGVSTCLGGQHALGKGVSTCLGGGGINMPGGSTCLEGLHALGGLHAWQRGATCLAEGGYMLGRGGQLHAWQRGAATCLAEGGGLHAWQGGATCLAEGGGYMLNRGGDYMFGRGGGDTCLAKERGITLAVQCKLIQSYIEDNPVKMIFCCAVVQMQMIIFSSTHTILRFKCRVIKNPLSLLSPPSYSCKYTNLDLQERGNELQFNV